VLSRTKQKCTEHHLINVKSKTVSGNANYVKARIDRLNISPIFIRISYLSVYGIKDIYQTNINIP
jgi:hypothetical protein